MFECAGEKMKITQTSILDSNMIDNNQTSKILLFDNLLEHVAPLFYEDLRKKHGQFSNNVAEIKKLKKIISGNHNQFLKLKNDIVVESLKNEILQKIQKLSTGSISKKMRLIVTEIITTLDDRSVVELKERYTLLQRITKNEG
jgi:KaiC/GvpD/RAD55 family RecA-like ATPase